MALERLFKVKISKKGQLVIPRQIREAYSFREGGSIVLIPEDEAVMMKPYPLPAKGLRGLLKGLKADPKECEEILLEAKRSLLKAGL